MDDFRVLSYIKKYRWYIVCASIFFGVVFYWRFSGKQSYTAEAVIQYTNPEALQGQTPDGTEIDTSDIYSTKVMTEVFQKLGLNYDKHNLEAVRANIVVKPILTDEEEAVQAALNEKGEVPTDKPTNYKISYTVKAKEMGNAKEFASQLVTNMLIVYSEKYAEEHINKTIAVNDVNGIYDKDYDYIEMIELLEGSIKKAVDNLLYKKDVEFRSSDTGYSFKDLYGEFKMLSEIYVPDVYAYILGNKVTKDQSVLLMKYQNRIKNSSLSNDSVSTQIDGIDEIIASYVRMMRESGNTNYIEEYILDEVYENYYKDITAEPGLDKYKNVDPTTEYDQLMNQYVNSRTNSEYELIDMAYNHYIYDIYSGQMENSNVQVLPDPAAALNNASGGTAAGRTANAAALPDTGGLTDGTVPATIVSTQEQLDTAYQMVKNLTTRMDSLYDILQKTSQEYNKYAGAANIAIVTDTAVRKGINLLAYAVMAVILFGVIGCVAAIVLGRMLEVFDYYAYVDKGLDIPNRAGCDKYMNKLAGRPLPPGFSSIVVRMPDIKEKNQKFGREQCDGMMRDFIKIVKQSMPDKTFIAVNSLGQFVVFLENTTKDYARIYVNSMGDKCRDYNTTHECKISYTCGLSTSDADQIYDIKKLMIAAVKKVSA